MVSAAAFAGLLVFRERLLPLVTDGGLLSAEGRVETLDVFADASGGVRAIVEVDVVAVVVGKGFVKLTGFTPKSR